MSEIKSISTGSYTIGQTSNLNFEAGTGIKITEPSEGTVRIANDETVLYDANGSPNQAGPWTLSEVPTNFEWIDIVLGTDASNTEVKVQRFKSDSTYMKVEISRGEEDPNWKISTMSLTFNQTSMSIKSNSIARVMISSSTGSVSVSTTATQAPYIYKVVGINRITGGNNE